MSDLPQSPLQSHSAGQPDEPRLFTKGNVCIGISRLDESEFAELRPPYRIVYEIDPWLTDATAPNDNVFESTFNSADAVVKVECHVSAGKVLASLAEWDAHQNNYVTRNADAATPQRGLFTLQGQKLSSGSWRVSLAKESGSPKFNLAYAKTVK